MSSLFVTCFSAPEKYIIYLLIAWVIGQDNA